LQGKIFNISIADEERYFKLTFMNQYIKFYGFSLAAISALVILVVTFGNKFEQMMTVSPVVPGVNLAYGKFMAESCIRCHGEDYGGGNSNITQSRLPAQNLTPDIKTGLGNWSEADFLRTIRTGRRPDGTKLKPQMNWKRISDSMTDMDLKAIWLYLRSLPPKSYDPKKYEKEIQIPIN